MEFNNKIDEDLYSRQLYVLGHDAMHKMSQSNILIIGLNSLGVEVAKNIILSGVLSVTLHDNKNTSNKDLSGQFYLSSFDIGKNRAECSINKLKELNSYVKVNYSNDDLTEDYISNFSVVAYCLSDSNINLIKINNMCRKVGSKFILGQTYGLTGRIFSDFGNNFTVNDNDGEQLKSNIVDKITVEQSKITIKCIDTKPHNLQVNEYIKFKNNNHIFQIIKIIDRFNFECEMYKRDDELFNMFKAEMYEQIKIPFNISFKNLEESFENPDFMLCDLSNFDKPSILHKCYNLLDKFLSKYNRFPKPYNLDDYKLFIETSQDNKIYKQFCYTCSGDLCPINAILGGILAQEIMKACSGKFTPIKQFLYFDAFECLNKEWETMDINEFTDTNNRYTSQISIFGKKFQEKLGNQKWFMVGSGAIGCELLKNFAMIGLCCGDKGQLTITDMDSIEKSNLNRQFLFRNKNIGQLKSEAAAIQIKGMNKDINIIPHQNKVGKETEHIYNDDFFNSLDGVANALDNIQARLFVDDKCVYYKKPLLESGTLGTKGNVQVIVPYLTESYGSTTDPPEESIPVCTLKNYPNQIEHTIQYARDQFEGLFTSTPEILKQYIENSSYLDDIKQNSPQDIYTTLNDLQSICNIIPNNFEDCVKWIRLFFESQYNNQIQQLLYNFPKNFKTTNGAYFWSGSKRCPSPLQFDENNKEHMDYIIAGANLMANVFGLEECNNVEIIKNILYNVKIPEFKPKNNIKISVTDDEEKENNKTNYNVEDIINNLPKSSELNIKVFPLKFEKDDNTNHHLDFITSSSNLRAINYGIDPISKHETKRIAGKIIPAIATTTAIVAGLVTLELYKLCQNHKEIESYRDTFLNLALPLFTISEPKPCKVNKYLNKKYTLWDSIDIEGDLTLEEFIDKCENTYGFEVDMITYGNSLLYAFYQPPTKIANKMNLKITDIIKNITNKNITSNSLLLNVGTHNPLNEDEDMEIPPIKLILNKHIKYNNLEKNLHK